MNYSLGNMLKSGGALNPDGLSLDLAFALDKTLTARKGPTPSFTRTQTSPTGSTYIGADRLIKYAAANEPRFDHDPVTGICRGFLIEESRGNLVTRSQEMNLWSGNAARSISTTVSPDGGTFGTLATSIAGPFGGLVRSLSNFSATIGQALTVSCWVKKGNWRYVSIVHDSIRSGGSSLPFFDLDTLTFNANGQGTFNSSIVSFPNGWYRLSISGTAASTTSSNLDVWMTNSLGGVNTDIGVGQTILLWGAQLEIGAFPTSYIPTTTAPLNRSADVCSITGADFTSFYNQSEGTVSVNASTPASGDRTIIGIDNNTADEMIRIRTEGTDPFYKVTDAGSDVVSLDLGAIVARTAFKVASCYKLNDFAASLNGATASTGITGTIPTGDRLRIGQGQAGNIMTGHIARIQYFKKRLPNAKLQSLTAP